MSNISSSVMPAFKAQWQAYQSRANAALLSCFDSLDKNQEEKLSRAMMYSTNNGGKRFRASLVYASGACFGADLKTLDAPAIALELIHAYSLIHDDLPAMDDDNLRRGKASCHIHFDEATAILAGDALQALAFEAIASAPLSATFGATQQIKMIKTLACASGNQGMAGGQALDINATGKTLTLADLQEIHQRKTGALIRAALTLGALAAPNINADELNIIDEYGRNLGLAFQVIDDILDITHSSEQLGKQSGADIALSKNTYPALMGLESARHYAAELIQSAKQSLGKLNNNTDFLAQLADFTQHRDH